MSLDFSPLPSFSSSAPSLYVFSIISPLYCCPSSSFDPVNTFNRKPSKEHTPAAGPSPQPCPHTLIMGLFQPSFSPGFILSLLEPPEEESNNSTGLCLLYGDFFHHAVSQANRKALSCWSQWSLVSFCTLTLSMSCYWHAWTTTWPLPWPSVSKAQNTLGPLNVFSTRLVSRDTWAHLITLTSSLWDAPEHIVSPSAAPKGFVSHLRALCGQLRCSAVPQTALVNLVCATDSCPRWLWWKLWHAALPFVVDTWSCMPTFEAHHGLPSPNFLRLCLT